MGKRMTMVSVRAFAAASWSFFFALFCLIIYSQSPNHLVEFEVVGGFMAAWGGLLSQFLPEIH